MNAWMNAWMTEWLNEEMNDCLKEWMNVEMHDWMNELDVGQGLEGPEPNRENEIEWISVKSFNICRR